MSAKSGGGDRRGGKKTFTQNECTPLKKHKHRSIGLIKGRKKKRGKKKERGNGQPVKERVGEKGKKERRKKGKIDKIVIIQKE